MISSQPVPAPLRPEQNSVKTLASLAREFGNIDDDASEPVQLHGMTLSSQDVEPADLFVALPGSNYHGARFALDARERGASAILVDREGEPAARASGLPVVAVDHLREELGEIAAWFYDTANTGVELFGVTGTNGKTSTTYILEAVLTALGVNAGLSSTAQRRFGDVEQISGLTTPEAIELHALIARMNEESVRAAAIEVSAQALSRHRVDGVVFDVAGFTNLSHDHLDDYGDLTSYFAAKAPLFTPAHAKRGVISLDSSWGRKLVDVASVPVTTIASTRAADPDWLVTVTAEKRTGVEFILTNRDGRSLSTRLSLLGRHMAANAGLAIAMLVEGGFDFAEIANAIEPNGIDVDAPGRTELVSGDRGPSVFVDFGHSADAFEKTLDAVRQVTEGKVIMVFGADGDRDATKRGDMARAALAGSDLLIITDHHPRFENPHAIRATLLEAARAADPSRESIEIADPKQAIRVAVMIAGEHDSILWAGPGHQNYRDIEGVHVPYSARAEAREALREAGWSAR